MVFIMKLFSQTLQNPNTMAVAAGIIVIVALSLVALGYNYLVFGVVGIPP